jgi:hypothetical protein
MSQSSLVGVRGHETDTNESESNVDVDRAELVDMATGHVSLTREPQQAEEVWRRQEVE